MTPEQQPAEERPAAPPPQPQPPATTPQSGGSGSWPEVRPIPDRSPSITPSPRASHADRNAIAERLRDAFADGRLDEDEFDVRIQAALSARTRAELEPLLADLLPEGTVAPVQAPGPVMPVSPGGAQKHALVVAIMGGAERKGRWRVPAESTAVAIMGGVELDLRAATLTSPVTTIRAAAIMGGVDIIVPPGVRVEMSGIPLMGGGDDRVDDANLPPTAPLVKVYWLALMGGVSVRTKEAKVKENRKEVRRREQHQRHLGHHGHRGEIED
jgi:Domain of unknown function (DUF1707)